MTKEDSSLRFRAEGVLRSLPLSLESNQMRVPASRKPIFKEATEIDPIIGRIADSSFMFEKRTGFDRLYSL